jgi:hypothetical protein
MNKKNGRAYIIWIFMTVNFYLNTDEGSTFFSLLVEKKELPTAMIRVTKKRNRRNTGVNLMIKPAWAMPYFVPTSIISDMTNPTTEYRNDCVTTRRVI